MLVGMLFAVPAGATRLKNRATALTLAAPTMSCSPSAGVSLSWADTGATSSSTYRVMSLPQNGRKADWNSDAWLGNVRTARVAAAQASTWQLAIESGTGSSNVRAVTVNCP